MVPLVAQKFVAVRLVVEALTVENPVKKGVVVPVMGEVPLPERNPVNVDAPVPASATVRSVMPVMEPPVMETLLEFCEAMVPNPETIPIPIVEVGVMVLVPLKEANCG